MKLLKLIALLFVSSASSRRLESFGRLETIISNATITNETIEWFIINPNSLSK